MSKNCTISEGSTNCYIVGSIDSNIGGASDGVILEGCTRVNTADATNVRAENCTDLIIEGGCENITLMGVSGITITPSSNNKTIIGNELTERNPTYSRYFLFMGG